MQQPQGDATGGLIPYKNPPALTAYYLGVFSLIPLIGLILGVAAVIMGVLGLRKRKALPQCRGGGHAWAGIILGGLSCAGHLAVVLLILLKA
jgi:hypothetical protein